MLRSALTCLLTLAPVLSAQNAKKETAPPKVVFVCEHGAAKSVIAAAYLEQLARERGLQVQAIARGTSPEPEIGPNVRNGLHADGIDLGDRKPVGVTAADMRGAVRVVSFGPDLSPFTGGKLKVEDWSATPAVSDDYKAARDYIRKRLAALLDELAKPAQ